VVGSGATLAANSEAALSLAFLAASAAAIKAASGRSSMANAQFSPKYNAKSNVATKMTRAAFSVMKRKS
jgi:hypothetical protein